MPASIATLTDLLGRVEEGTGADRELDADILLGLGVLTRQNLLDDCPDEDPVWRYFDAERQTMGGDICVRPLTASTDVTFWLIRRDYPLVHAHIESGLTFSHCELVESSDRRADSLGVGSRHDDDLARAALAALLKAKIAEASDAA